jgi:hypothetical protein
MIAPMSCFPPTQPDRMRVDVDPPVSPWVREATEDLPWPWSGAPAPNPWQGEEPDWPWGGGGSIFDEVVFSGQYD